MANQITGQLHHRNSICTWRHCACFTNSDWLQC